MKNSIEIATIAGGCFWCTEAIFKRLKGVKSVIPGYSGGNVIGPTYAQVCSGTTGHAEAIQVGFDPTKISFEKILEIFFHTHNPTTLNQQGNDIGTQYRSVIFFHDKQQKTCAIKKIRELEKVNTFRNKIVTEIIPFSNFFPSEDYHKNYFDRNKQDAYCDLIITPKIHKLLKEYSSILKEEFKKID